MGLFAEHDFGEGAIITKYEGETIVYAKPRGLCPSKRFQCNPDMWKAAGHFPQVRVSLCPPFCICSPPSALLSSSACSPLLALLRLLCSPPPALPRLLSSACSPPPALLNSLSSTRSPPPALLLSSTYSCSTTPALLYLLSSARSPALLYLLPSARSRRQVTFRAVWMVAVKRSIADAAGLESLFTLTVRCGWRVAFGANAACARS